MHVRIVLPFVLAASTCWGLSEENIDQKFSVAPGGQLVVDVGFGSIDVATGGDNEVAVRIHRKIDAGDEAREKDFLAAAPVVVSQEGNVVTVRARPEKNRDCWDWDRRVEMNADYIVRVPKTFDAELRTSGGAIAANGLTGKIIADTKGGKMKFAELRGSLDARTSGGSISLEACAGELSVVTKGGTIDCQKGSGGLAARTSGGAILVRDFDGDTEVKTSGGKLTLENVSGALTGKTSAGSISVALPNPLPGDVQLQTGAGSIDVALSEKAAVTVNAKTGMGSIRTEIPMLATRSRDDRLEGTLNGGGKSLLLQASVGSITIRPVTPAEVTR